MNNYSLTPVGIVGFRGYSGQEMLHILAHHPHVRPVLLEHFEKEERPRPVGHPGPPRLPCTPEAVKSAGLAAVFLATPADVSMELAPALLDAGAKVIDLSGAFRLGTAENFERWYREKHTRPDLLAEAAYGLPEFCRERIAGARLIANPGCYPTAANLALRPLIDAGVIAREAGIVCDAKSGVSGAGRKPSLKTSFCEVTENFSTYAILEHRPRRQKRNPARLRDRRRRVELHGPADSHRSRHSRNHLFPGQEYSVGRRYLRHLPTAVPGGADGPSV